MQRNYPWALLASCIVMCGCATSTAQKKDAKADSAEYEYVTPLGSNIPVKVKKGDTAQTSSPTGSMSGARLENELRSAGGQMGGARGSP